jgi:hypothetical protein
MLVQPVIEVQDRFGNRVPNFIGDITASTIGNMGQLSDRDVLSPTEITMGVVDGLASFLELNLVATPGDQVELRFTSGSLLGITSQPVTVRAAETSQIAVFTQPVGARTGSQLAVAPVVELRDRFGNRALADDSSLVQVVSSGGTLTGATTVTATAGRVSFSDLVLTGVPGRLYTLSFTGSNSANQSLTSANTSKSA